MTVGPTSGPPMHMGLCRGHVGVVWWVWFGCRVGCHTYVHTYVHTLGTVNKRVKRRGAAVNQQDQAPQACKGHVWAS